ncbi:acyltransferase family protein [Orientia chuto str. Dubai]|uniref:Acyltransferase family protein n=1 Tax=Orientia chuto str. Dubai TaxID=1359168 RepID=A0A0F3MPY4_9RICK|nr:lysophospholipid acyltransferase family protein [Candidatus Orientia mediorientalis]KJV57522.1 acyltransferase family protein [Orientia chuto str. Dubai]
MKLKSAIIAYFCTILFFLIIAIISIVFLLIMLIAILFSRNNYKVKYFIAKLYVKFFVTLLRVICGLSFQVQYDAKLPLGPAVVLSNHQSFWENAAVLLLFPMQSWVVKQELFNIPVFGWGLKLMDPVHVNRNDFWSVKKILTIGQQKIKNGLWMIMFPESSRIPTNIDKRFKPSGVKLASLAKAPIVLMAHNAGVFWPARTLLIRPGIIKVILGPVIEYNDYRMLSIRELNNLVEFLITKRKKLLLNNVDN